MNQYQISANHVHCVYSYTYYNLIFIFKITESTYFTYAFLRFEANRNLSVKTPLIMLTYHIQSIKEF